MTKLIDKKDCGLCEQKGFLLRWLTIHSPANAWLTNMTDLSRPPATRNVSIDWQKQSNGVAKQCQIHTATFANEWTVATISFFSDYRK